MNVLLLFPVFFSALLMGAHLYRHGWPAAAVACLAVLFLLFLRRPWVPGLFRLLLLAGAVEWLRTLYLLVADRMAMGEDWARLAMILAGVAVFTALSGLVFGTKRLKAFYAPPRGD